MKAQREEALFCIFLLIATLAKGSMNFPTVVYPILLEARSINATKVVKLTDEITLNLSPTDVLSDTFVVSTATKLNLEHNEIDTANIGQTLYHDEAYMAAVSMQDVEGTIEMTGLIGDRMRIEPLPFSGRTSNGRRPHRLFYARSISAREDVKVPGRVSVTDKSSAKRRQRYSNYAEVEVCFIIDTMFSERFPEDTKAINYLAVTLAAVNLRYKSVRNMQIKFIAVGMLRLTSELQEEFVIMDGSYIDGQSTLVTLKTFCHRQGFASADVRYFITGLDITGTYRGRKNPIMGGYAYVGGLCSLDGVAIGEDTPGLYTGVDIMAHELAHSLGCVHDGEGPRTELPGHKGSTAPDCAAYHGYLMSYSRNGGKNHYKFSPCCEEQMKLLLRLVADECIEKTFNVTQVFPKSGFLPGHWITPHKYCTMKQPTLKIASPPTMVADRNCKLQCRYVAGSLQSTIQYEALDGMRCQGGIWCENGVCL